MRGKRYEDEISSSSSLDYMLAGSIEDVKWKKVKVGDLLQVRDDEDIAADLVCIGCSHPDNVCFIKTTNLDGVGPAASVLNLYRNSAVVFETVHLGTINLPFESFKFGPTLSFGGMPED